MKTFVTSDTHFGHNNIIRYCQRPFQDAASMDASMIERWNSRVSEDDTVYFLGDFAFASQKRIASILSMLNFKQLIVVPGNHDNELLAMWNHPVWESWGVRGVSVVSDTYKIRHDGKVFVMCHYPIADWDDRYKGSIHLHGHCHSRSINDGQVYRKYTTEYPNGTTVESSVPFVENRYDVGVDIYGGPVELTGDLRYLHSPKGWK